MRIAMVSEHASPLACVGGVDAGGQNVYVAEVSAELARRGHQVVVYTRSDRVGTARCVRMLSGVDVEHVVAGPQVALPKDELLPYMPAFGEQLATGLGRGAARRRARPLLDERAWRLRRRWPAPRIPMVQTFHALGTVKRRWQGAADTSAAERLTVEARLAESVDRIIATCSDEAAELRLIGRPRRAESTSCPAAWISITSRPRPGGARPASECTACWCWADWCRARAWRMRSVP